MQDGMALALSWMPCLSAMAGQLGEERTEGRREDQWTTTVVFLKKVGC